MLEHLFGSKTRADILRLFFREPERAFYVRELTRLLDTQINAVRRELELLISLDIIHEKEADLTAALASGEAGAALRKYYLLNTEHVIFSELKALVMRSQLIDEQELLDELKEKAGDIKLLLVTGAFTGDKRAPTDILLVGAIKPGRVTKIIESYESRFGFPIRYTNFTEKEFTDRRHIMDKFLFSVFEAEHVFVVKKLVI